MARKLQFKRGNKAQMPVLDVGEPAFATDEGKLYLGSSTGNIALARGDHSHPAASVGLAYGICSTAAWTAAKTVSASGFSLSPGAVVFVLFQNGVPKNATLNVNNTGAKPIRWWLAAIGEGGIGANNTCEFVYTGSSWDLIAIDRMAAYGGTSSVSFAADSWDTIQLICARGQHGKYYAKGDTKTIALGTGESITVRIEDFDHDDLESGGIAPLSLMMVDGLNTKKCVNGANTNVGGWTQCNLRYWLSNEMFYQLPGDLQRIIKPVQKITSAGNHNASRTATIDKLWLPSYTEMNLPYNASYSPGGEGRPYPLFIGDASRIKKCNGSADGWWLRSPYATNSASFDFVYSNGSYAYTYASTAYAVVAGFCI